VTFDASASAGTAPLTYTWRFGDGSKSRTGRTVAHTYATARTYTATLVVRDGSGATATMSRVITATNAANTPPVPTILSPTEGALFAVGEQVTVTGQATDVEDGQEPPERLAWQVLLHHVPSTGPEHVHPLASGSGGSIAFAYPAPEDLAATAGSFVEVVLTATDAAGASASSSRRLDPRRVAITLASQPTGLLVTLATPSDPTRTVAAPFSFTSWQGWSLTIGTPSPQGNRRFRSWSDGGARTHVVTTPATATTYRATFGK
jgi:PKD repeat protein